MEHRNVLVVDDLAKQANIVRENIKERSGYRPIPTGIEGLLSSVLFNIYEGAMIDVFWDKLHPVLPERVLDRYSQIKDGIDFADLMFKLNPELEKAIALYSTVLTAQTLDDRIRSLPFKPKLISTPFSRDSAENKKRLAPLLTEVDRVYRSNPLLQSPDFVRSPLNTRSRTYKRIAVRYSKWLDFQFDVVGDYSWALVCGQSVQKKSYGVPLNGTPPNEFEVEGAERYPTTEELEDISRRTKFFPFMLWNTRKPEFIEYQFELAGEGLRKIPEYCRQFFAIAIARRCPDLYCSGQEEKVFNWCRELDHYGRVEVAKEIFKALRNEPRRATATDRFAQALEKREFPVIVDVLLGRVDSFDDEKKSAYVVMKTYEGEYFIETISTSRLVRSGIKFVDTWFEYTVYRQPRGEVIGDIEPCDPDEENE